MESRRHANEVDGLASFSTGADDTLCWLHRFRDHLQEQLAVSVCAQEGRSACMRRSGVHHLEGSKHLTTRLRLGEV